MRKLFTTMLMLLLTVAMSAQDASDWSPEQEITDELTWQNVKYTGDQSGWEKAGGAGVGWFYDASKAESGSIEMYNNQEGAELYQIFWLPAGYYRFTVQGFYRPSNWGTNFEDEFAVFFCDAVDEQEIETEDGDIEYKWVATRQTSKPLRHITSDAYEGEDPLFTCTDWQADSGWKKDGVQYWVPNSMWGTSLYFDDSRYENEFNVVQIEDGYVKLGIRKVGHGDGDWTIFNNFRAFYISDAGEAVQLMLAQEEVLEAEKKVEALGDKIADEYGSLAALLGDAMMEIQESEEYNKTIDECKATIAKLNELVSLYNQYYAEAKSLTSLIVKCNTLNEIAQDATFVAAIDAAIAVEQDGNGDNEMTLESPDAYRKAMEALAQARVNYLTSQPTVDGAWDFTNLIGFPWFCNEEYNPTWSDEEGSWVYPDVVLNGDGEHNGYASFGEGSQTWTGADNYLIIADKVVLNSKPKTGEWYKVGPVGHEPYWNHGFSSAKAWSTPGDNREIKQDITGLPSGFYAVKGMCITWNIDWDASRTDPAKTCNMGVYIESSDSKAVSKEIPQLSGWWGMNRNDWQTFTTDMVRVTDGAASVAFFSNGFSSHTGMQLLYYGENPDFTAMLKPEIEEIEAIELTLDGDRAHVAALLASLPETINGFDEYEAARATLAEARAYANAANTYMASWETGRKFMDLQSQYEEDVDEEYAMLEPTWEKTLNFEEEEGVTYLDAQAIENDYQAYVKYLDVRKEMLTVSENNAELAELLKEQCEAMKAAYVTAATIESYLEALAAPYNKAILASLNADKATVDNPVDISQLVVNPTFENAKNGWDGDFTVSNDYKNAEVWNASQFRVAQTIYNLPAGSYRIRVQAFYRDAAGAEEAYKNFYYEELKDIYGDDEEDEEDEEFDDEEGDDVEGEEGDDEPVEENGYHAYVKLFANANSVPVVSIASEKFAEPSMTERIEKWEEDIEATEAYLDEHADDPDFDPDYKAMVPVYAYMDMDDPKYPFDQLIYDEADTWDDLWYPNSMEGTMNRFKKSPEAYINTIDVALQEAGNITFGLEKLKGINADWCMFDNWQLLYISPDPAVGISTPSAAHTATTKAIYNISGIQQQSLQSGINIIRMSDGTVRKVIKK